MHFLPSGQIIQNCSSQTWKVLPVSEFPRPNFFQPFSAFLASRRLNGEITFDFKIQNQR